MGSKDYGVPWHPGSTHLAYPLLDGLADVIYRAGRESRTMATTSWSTHEQALLDEVSTEELMNSTRTIAQWERYSGTPDEAKAFDWIESKLQGDRKSTRLNSSYVKISYA